MNNGEWKMENERILKSRCWKSLITSLKYYNYLIIILFYKI
jgi:hypothetical protein